MIKWEVMRHHLKEVLRHCQDKFKCEEIEKLARKALVEVDRQSDKKDKSTALEQARQRAIQSNNEWLKSLQDGANKLINKPAEKPSE